MSAATRVLSLVFVATALASVAGAQAVFPALRVARSHAAPVGGPIYFGSNQIGTGGDFTGDGVPDYAIGAPLYPSGNPTAPGAAFVYSGSTGALVTQANGATAGENLGSNVTMGPVTPTGTAAVLIGAPNFNGAVVGGAFTGRVAILSATPGLPAFLYPPSPPPGLPPTLEFGGTIALPGDLNADGFPDIVVGSNMLAPNPGRVFVFWGPSFSSATFLAGSANGDSFGTSVAAIGDGNGDGRPDFAVGAPNHPLGGRLHVFTVPVGGFLPTQYTTPRDGSIPGGQYANWIAGVGDVNNNLLGDIAVSNNTASAFTDVVSGTNLGLIRSHPAIQGVCAGGKDFDSDGVSDYSVSGRIYSGATGQLLFVDTTQGAACAAAFLGDVNGDCVPEWMDCSFATTPTAAGVFKVTIWAGPALTVHGGNCTGGFGWQNKFCSLAGSKYLTVAGPALPAAPPTGWFFDVDVPWSVLELCVLTAPFNGTLPLSGTTPPINLTYATTGAFTLCGSTFDVVTVVFGSAPPFIAAVSNVARITL